MELILVIVGIIAVSLFSAIISSRNRYFNEYKKSMRNNRKYGYVREHFGLYSPLVNCNCLACKSENQGKSVFGKEV